MINTFIAEDIETIFRRRFSTAADVQLLHDGGDSFTSIFEAVAGAERFICLIFYIFRNDSTGIGLAEILKRKSREGIRVYIIYDHFGSFFTPRSFWRDMKDAGIRVRASRPFKWTSPLLYVHRDHRKLIIIDQKTAFTGGLNIANEYSGFHLKLRVKAWRDTGVMLEGPIVRELMKSFIKSWYTCRGEQIAFPDVPLPGQSSFRMKIASLRKRLLRKQSHEELPDEEAEIPTAGLPTIPIFVDSARGRRRMRRLLYYSINHSKRGIDLTTAYFIPSRRMVETLEKAVKRGARVRLLAAGKSDMPLASYAGKAFFSRLLKAGVEIYTYTGEILHAKTFLFDGCWTIIGSTNLDFRSLRYNDEGNVGILDAGFAEKMTALFERDLMQANRLKLEHWIERPLVQKVMEFIFSSFRRRL